jgi:hypothetical protein
MLDGERQYKQMTGPPTSWVLQDTVHADTLFFHTSNDSVYFLRSGKLQFVWHLNPSVGDIWDMGLQEVTWPNDTVRAYAKVTSVYDHIINGDTTREFVVLNCKDSLGTLYTTGDTVGGYFPHLLGPINQTYGPFFFLEAATYYTPLWLEPFDLTKNDLLCYEASNFNPHQFYSNRDCNDGLFSAIDEIQNNQLINLYPVIRKINVAGLDRECLLTVFNMLGQVVSSKQIDPNKPAVDLSDLPTGFYLCNIVDEEGNVLKQAKIVKE